MIRVVFQMISKIILEKLALKCEFLYCPIQNIEQYGLTNRRKGDKNKFKIKSARVWRTRFSLDFHNTFPFLKLCAHVAIVIRCPNECHFGKFLGLLDKSPLLQFCARNTTYLAVIHLVCFKLCSP